MLPPPHKDCLDSLASLLAGRSIRFPLLTPGPGQPKKQPTWSSTLGLGRLCFFSLWSPNIESQFEDQPDPCNIAKAKTRVTKTSLIFPVQKKNLLPMIASEESSGWRVTKPLVIPGSPLGSAPFRDKACLTNFFLSPSLGLSGWTMAQQVCSSHSLVVI